MRIIGSFMSHLFVEIPPLRMHRLMAKLPRRFSASNSKLLAPRETPRRYLTAYNHSDRALAIALAASCNVVDPLITVVFDKSRRCRSEQLKMMATPLTISR